ncbi:MAG: hypothetical protein K2X95_03650 [Flavobacteriaceae bacterium]|nr:hypothetical protein [Flavobacteriaceae bacterium]
MVVVLVIPVMLKTVLPEEPSLEMEEKYTNPKNPFTVSKDSSELVWNRALEFLEKRKLIIVGGTLETNDSVIYMPYYNDFYKGTSLKIERKQVADSILFTVKVWNSGKPVPLGAKEIALYMKTGIDRNKLHFAK